MKALWLLFFISISLIADNQRIEKYVNDKFLKTYPNMHINNLIIKRYSNLPKDFASYKLSEIYIAKNNLKREKGNVSVTFINNNQKRKIFYNFTLDATVDVLRANQDIQRGKTLTDDLVDFVSIKFTNFYQMPITAYHLNKYRAKTSIIEGKILTYRHISKLTAIKRGDMITATLRDGGVIVTFPAQALKDAHIGDVIKIKRNHNSFFQAKIISQTQALVIK